MNKRVCFVFIGNIYLCPYINKYIKLLDCDYDIIYWNRDGIKEETKAKNCYSLNYHLGYEDSIFKKVKGYLAFKKYASRILRTNKYDYVIILNTIAGILLRRTLVRYYFKKFLLDIRDYTFEFNKIFYSLEKDLINASYSTVISSKGYESFLPPFEYTVVHNHRQIDKIISARIRNRDKNKKKLVIAFIGYIKYQDQHKELLYKFKNDERFELHFIGQEAERLIPFCRENNINNCVIEGHFLPDKILYYYEKVDIINNLYGNNNPTLDYALSNKLYFAAELGMPILVCRGTYMQKIAEEDYGFGYTFELGDPNACDKLYNYYHNIDWRKFMEKCDLFLANVQKENMGFEKKVKEFIQG